MIASLQIAPASVGASVLALAPLFLLSGMPYDGRADEASACPSPDRAPDFVLDVLPTLTRAGCNVGKCHGSALGQGGFRLSLMGGDPRGDWERITRELRGRRLDLDRPADSLLLRKATRRTSHGGGRVLDPRGPFATLLETWITAGAPFRTDDAQLSHIDARLSADSERLEVRAAYIGGESRDIEELSRFTSLDESIVRVDEEGVLERLRPGRASVLVRYLGEIDVVEVIEPLERDGELDFAVANFVDELVRSDLLATGKSAGPACDDASFLRRASLDLIGRLPKPEEVRAFLANPDRDALLDRLLADPAFADLWAMRLSLLFPRSQKLLVHLREQIALDRPWNELTRELLLSTGTEPGSAIFLPNKPSLVAENVTEAFLGLKIHCAGCHDHPFTSFRQQDYFSMTAFFAQTRVENGGVVLSSRGEVRDPLSGRIIPPAFPGKAPLPLSEGVDRRAPLAEWIVEQAAFRRALVNRVWRYLMGRGFVEPTNDLRVSNPADGERVLAGISERFAAEGYDLRKLVGWIVRSESYRRLREPHLMEAAVLHDALHDALGAWSAESSDQRAVLRPYQDNDLLAVSGLGEEDFEGSLEQVLYLIHSEELQQYLEQLPELDLDELYLRTLSRLPTRQERTLTPRSKAECEDLTWALLNSREFLYGR